MHQEAMQFVRRQLGLLPPRRRVLEIGGLNINGSVRSLFMGAGYTAIDIVPGPGVDVVADGATYRPDSRPDTVVCCEVLEHAPNAEEIVRNAYAMLAPGGVLILTAASEGRAPHSAIDGGALRKGEFYRNVRVAQLERWLSDFPANAVRVEFEARGDVYALATKEP